jgi:hypothetical protein
MKVRELIKALSKCSPDAEVILSKDSEGNGFSPCANTYDGFYVAENTWSGEFYDDADEAEGDGDEAVLLVPVN